MLGLELNKIFKKNFCILSTPPLMKFGLHGTILSSPSQSPKSQIQSKFKI